MSGKRDHFLPRHYLRQTVECKLLKAPSDDYFVTSDHPVVILNQFCIGAHPVRSFVGFSLSGFQLLLPFSPSLCAFFYDAKVYKVGSRRHRALEISSKDVAVVNSLQVQSAGNCLYFHSPRLAQKVEELIHSYSDFENPHNGHSSYVSWQKRERASTSP